MLFIIKVTTNKEDKAVEMISDRAVEKNLSVFTIARPHGLKGYMILEAVDRERERSRYYFKRDVC